MYGNKLAAAIKVNGRVLKEFKDTVYVKFGSEYSVYMKNLNITRALVNVFIDGTNITPGGLVINAGQEVDLQRSITNGNLTEGNSLKFIERTGAVEKHRGIKLEDGLIRVEYQFEKVIPNLQVNYINNNNWWSNTYGTPGNWTSSAFRGTSSGLSTSNALLQNSVESYSTSASCTNSSYTNDVGITVPGSVSNQKFNTASWFATEAEKHSIVLKLLGETPDNKPITQAVTVKNKPKCVTCGKQNKATAKFCTECGTGLLIPV
jgi:hypothetical protein